MSPPCQFYNTGFIRHGKRVKKSSLGSLLPLLSISFGLMEIMGPGVEKIELMGPGGGEI